MKPRKVGGEGRRGVVAEIRERARTAHHPFFITAGISPQRRNEPHSHVPAVFDRKRGMYCSMREARIQEEVKEDEEEGGGAAARRREKPGAIVNGARA